MLQSLKYQGALKLPHRDLGLTDCSVVYNKLKDTLVVTFPTIKTVLVVSTKAIGNQFPDDKFVILQSASASGFEFIFNRHCIGGRETDLSERNDLLQTLVNERVNIEKRMAKVCRNLDFIHILPELESTTLS